MLPTNICRWFFVQVKADEPKLLRVSRAAHELGLHPFTVRKWIKAGKIQAIWVGKEARVPRSEIERLVGKTDGRLLVLYGRVSGQGQKGDLDTQPERLTRFGQAYLQALFDSFSVTLTVLDPGEDKTAEQELTADLLALLASFSGRLYGMRSHKQQELLKCAQAVINNP